MYPLSVNGFELAEGAYKPPPIKHTSRNLEPGVGLYR